MNILILTTTNDRYFIYLEALLYALKEHNANVDIFVELVNVVEYKKKWLLTQSCCVGIDDTKIKFPSINEEKGYCTNRRVFLLSNRDLLRRYDYAIYMDVNTLIMRPLSDYISRLEPFDAAIAIDESHELLNQNAFNKMRTYIVGPLGTPYYGVMLAGVQIYKVNENVLNMLQDYRSIVEKASCSWFSDQEGLYLVYKKHLGRIRFLNILGDISFDNRPDEHMFLYVKGGNEVVYERISREYLYNDIGTENLDKVPRSCLEQKNPSVTKGGIYWYWLRFLNLIYRKTNLWR